MRLACLALLVIAAAALCYHFGTSGKPPVLGFLNEHVDAIVLDSEVTTVEGDDRGMVLVIYERDGVRRSEPLGAVEIGPWWRGGLSRASDGIAVDGYAVGDTVTVRLPSHASMRATHPAAAPLRWAGFLFGVALGAVCGCLALRHLYRLFKAPKSAPMA